MSLQTPLISTFIKEYKCVTNAGRDYEIYIKIEQQNTSVTTQRQQNK